MIGLKSQNFLEKSKKRNASHRDSFYHFLDNASRGDVVLLSSRYELRWGDFPIPERQKNLKFIFFDKNDEEYNQKEAFEAWKIKFIELNNELKKREINLVLFSSFPTFRNNYHHLTNPQWFNKFNKEKNSISRAFLENHYAKVNNYFRFLSKNNENIYYFDIFEILCKSKKENCVQNENYRDEWHLSKKGANFIYPEFIRFLKEKSLLK